MRSDDEGVEVGISELDLQRIESRINSSSLLFTYREEVKRSMYWLIKRLIKVGARVSYHARRWYVHVASDFPLANHYRAVLDWAP
jgi:hypothetical protein